MTDDQRVRTLLDSLAADAPSAADAIPAGRLLPRIRRRRRMHAVVPVCAALAVAGLTASVFSTLPGDGDARDVGPGASPADSPPAGPFPALPPPDLALPSGPAPSGSAPAGSAPAGSAPSATSRVAPAPAGSALGACGARVSVPHGDAALRLALRMPPDVPAGGSVPATLTLTNSSTAAVRGFTVSAPTVVLASRGVVVALPPGSRDVARLVDLAAGASVDLPVTVYLERCPVGTPPDRAGKTPVAPPPGHPLTPGTYQAYAVVEVQRNDGGATLTATGGPWAVRLN